jgi:hypothetical protein
LRQAVQNLNKRALADATGISYRRLRSYSSGVLEKLTDSEIKRIYEYLIDTAKKFTK